MSQGLVFHAWVRFYFEEGEGRECETGIVISDHVGYSSPNTGRSEKYHLQ